MARQPGETDRGAARRRMRWDLVLITVLAVAVGVVVLIDKPSILTGAISSPVAIAVSLAIGLVVLGTVVVAQRFMGNAALRFVVMLIPLAAAVWFLVVPAYRPTSVEEALPGTAPTATPATPVAGAPVDTAAPTEAAPTVPPATPTGDTAGTAAAMEPTPAAPVVVATGNLAGLTGHDATGTVATYLLDDGSHAVRFEAVSIEPGPDYVVYLVPGAEQTDPAGSWVDLGPLTATDGSFNYTVPAGFDATQPFTVLVWCRAFAVEIAAATQQPV